MNKVKHPMILGNMPNMSKVYAALEQRGLIPTPKVYVVLTMHSRKPKTTPIDAGIRKTVKKVRRGCCGFYYEPFHHTH